MGFEHTNSRGQKYFLHSRDVGTKGAKLFFFSKSQEGAVDLEGKYEVFEGPTGLPMLRKKG